MTKRVSLLGLCVLALLVGVAYVVVSQASGVVSVVMIGLPVVLAVCCWLLGER